MTKRNAKGQYCKVSDEEAKLQEQLAEIRQVETKNALAIASQKLEQLYSKGVPVLREQDPINGWPMNFFGDIGSTLGVNSFPREMHPDMPTTLRTGLANDAARLQSRQFYEICPNYSGLINHLRNFIVGSGMDIKVVSDDDQELADDIKEILDNFANFKQNKLQQRVDNSVLNLLRDGDDFSELIPAKEGTHIRTVDSSTVRGPHNEITGPWSFGILTNWPKDYEDVIAYHVWYSDNTHEDKSPKLFKHLKAETVGANVKRGIPLSYKMRKQLEQIMRLSDCSAIGEAARQSIPYIQQYELAQKSTINGIINSRIPPPIQTFQIPNANSLNDPKAGIIPGDIRHIGPGQEFVQPPTGVSSEWAYIMLCNEIATAANVPQWMVSGSSSDTNFASSLVAEAPLVKLVQKVQRIVCEYWKSILEAVVEISIASGELPLDSLELVEIHCELPNIVSRNRKEEIEIDIEMLKADVLSPQHLAARNNLDWDEEMALIEKAKSLGWEKPTDMPTDGANGDNPNNEKKKLE